MLKELIAIHVKESVPALPNNVQVITNVIKQQNVESNAAILPFLAKKNQLQPAANKGRNNKIHVLCISFMCVW